MAMVKSPSGQVYNYNDAEMQSISGQPGWEILSGGENEQPMYPGLTNQLDQFGNIKEQYRVSEGAPVEYGSILPGLEGKLSGINLNKQGLEAFRKRALSEDESSYAKMARQKLGLEKADRLDTAKREAASGVSSATSGLAMRGGASAGARERL